MYTAHGYAAHSSTTPLVPHTFSRRDLHPNDVRIDILFCGVCHSDIHTIHGDWDGTVYTHGTLYPCIPGHEIVGKVHSVGAEGERVPALALRGSEGDNVRAKGVRELDAHVAEASNADDADTLAGAGA